MKKKIALIGHLAFEENMMIGAVVKSRNLYKSLLKEFGGQNVLPVDIYGWKRKFVSIFFLIIFAFFRCETIILVISETNQRLMLFFRILKFIFMNKVFYVAVGANLGHCLRSNKKRISMIKFIDSFFVETWDCVEELKEIGLANVEILVNFKMIESISITDVIKYENKIFKFCTFSRVALDKGISDAIHAIYDLNKNGYNCSLDVYGPIDKSYSDEFNLLMNKYSKYCKYCGVISEDKSVNVLRNYYCMLFPTKFKTEGIPGTIVDSFAAALPIICSRWPRSNFVVSEGIDSIVYTFNNYCDLLKSLKYSMKNPDEIYKLRFGALESFSKYKPENAISPLLNKINKGGSCKIANA